MQFQPSASQHAKSRKAALLRLIAAVSALTSAPAFAQITKVDTVMTNVQNLLIGIAVTVFTIAILWAAYKMAFQHAKWSEISNIVIGGILAGGAPGIAAWLIN
ncbi:TrbC/VirB2 family protein [Massilia sp. R2A-15]|uniref:TrbC/VirB2 family protein n=1 Tax=Massilia sp. R2A-15 TaxID=3064278 RepID=UPI002737491A|nr:TrbC/VirB2 family protein [Massilia sp. R2A-15]WLI91085.1 TrbC/VirB2 family protein [Massilia sp. R2A-15]